MTAQLSLEARRVPQETSEEADDVFPLQESRSEVRSREALVLGVGAIGAAVVETACARCPALGPLCLTEGATTDDLQRVMRAFSSPNAAGWMLWDGRLDLLAIGQPKELEAALGPFVDRLAAVADGSKVSLMTLELGDPSGATVLTASGAGAPARFRLARDYYHGRLSPEHQTDLAGRLLGAGLPSALAERSAAARRAGVPLALGGAVPWEPEATVGELVALELELECFRMVTSPGRGAAQRLSTLLRGSAPAPLAARLQGQLRREEAEFIERFSAIPETAPVECLLEDAHVGEEEAARAVRAWCADVWQGARLRVYELLTRRYGLRTGLATLARGERELQKAADGLATREQGASAARRSVARRAVTLDLKRRAAARRWPPLRQFLS